ncbi:DUF72 domain-containing protein [Paenibacillus hexagrammi]|uniref:DUF72 domain-containing protein n=1 Tax=Paenibacillus hexagrammi TaxID=2908839 RepID=A0ABY3SIH2_9BACL|nr:DUF72 domain-containing protein [Paenibacillus sp. YPD9-1]UJF33529.1 DUF72 domain-containing protein [Paenibacillus sp. YPD9-1]
MISIGLAGWGDHELIYPTGIKPQDRLKQYSKYFSTVEVDSSYYAIHKPALMERWAAETPSDFTFLIKAYQGMTGHTRQSYSEQETHQMFESFKESIEPVQDGGKLKAVLFQYPPWFDCSRGNVSLIRSAKERMGDIPVALEFRHQSWFTPEMRSKTLSFMRDEGWIHSICDEPQVFPGSIPMVLEPTDSKITVVRFHGRNAGGWTSGGGAKDWREVRYLYRYSMEELREWAARLTVLEKQSGDICVIFNNNSGGDAAANAMQLIELLGLDKKELPPEQLEMFE